MKTNIFNIQARYLELERLYFDIEDIEDEKLQEEAIKKLEAEMAINLDEFEDKMRAYAGLIKSLNGDVNIIKDEISRLSKMRKSKENLIERLKSTMLSALLMCGNTGKEGNKTLDLPDMKFYTRSIDVVSIEDEDNFMLNNIEFVRAKLNHQLNNDDLRAILRIIRANLRPDEEIKIEYSIDKVRLKEELKAAVPVPGACLKPSQSIIIK